MDEKIKIIHEIEEIEKRILGMVEHMHNFAKALRKLVPKMIEEKVELVDGQIYRFNTSSKTKTYYLLQEDCQTWSLLNLKSRNTFWNSNQSYHIIQNVIQKDFILCPDAKIVVINTGNIDFAKE